MRFFNTAGACNPQYHYMVPAAERLPDAPRLIDQGGYFVVHAPRQTGKSTSLIALAEEVTGRGEFAALYFSCEVGRSLGEDLVAVQRAILRTIHQEAELALPPELRPPTPWPAYDDSLLLSDGLRAWAQQCPRRLVLIFDEIDALHGRSLLNVLSQLRANFRLRPKAAPWSVILCGLRDVRDYKAASGGDPSRLGSSSPFNIKVESMRLGDFTADEVAMLYAQHTADTGQEFTAEAVDRAFDATRGQPWLVNSLAREIIEKMNIAPPEPITAEHVNQARERLILARATHLDSLAARLTEPRVRRIIEPLMAGTLAGSPTYNDDVSYVRDLGLIAPGREVRVANPIYREVIARVLSESVEDQVPAPSQPFVMPDGRLDMNKLLAAFAEFWREHGEALIGKLAYHEVAPQLVLMAFLQKIVNGGGFIDREYGLGRGRMDLLIRWPYHDSQGHKQWQREAVEIKVWPDKKADPRERGLAQLDGYLDQLGLDHGVLVIFDRRTDAPPHADRIAMSEDTTPSNRPVLLLRA